jgi:hypothetical protein
MAETEDLIRGLSGPMRLGQYFPFSDKGGIRVFLLFLLEGLCCRASGLSPKLRGLAKAISSLLRTLTCFPIKPQVS